MRKEKKPESNPYSDEKIKRHLENGLRVFVNTQSVSINLSGEGVPQPYHHPSSGDPTSRTDFFGKEKPVSVNELPPNKRPKGSVLKERFV